MVLVVGEIPSEIRVSRDQYLGLLARLDAATHSGVHAQVELAYDLIGVLRVWTEEIKTSGQVEGQLELPLEWAADRAAR